jgi:hypothetical protein
MLKMTYKMFQNVSLLLFCIEGTEIDFSHTFTIKTLINETKTSIGNHHD